LPGVRKLYLGPQRHLPQVRHLRRDQRMQLRAAKCWSALQHAMQQNLAEAPQLASSQSRLRSRLPHAYHFASQREAATDFSYPTARSKLDIVVTRLLRSITHIAEIVVKNLTISYASRKPRVTYGRFAGDFERRVRQRLFESHVNTCEGKCVENAVALPSFAMTRFSNEMRVRAASGCS
jgi:hypothetical protein